MAKSIAFPLGDAADDIWESNSRLTSLSGTQARRTIERCERLACASMGCPVLFWYAGERERCSLDGAVVESDTRVSTTARALASGKPEVYEPQTTGQIAHLDGDRRACLAVPVQLRSETLGAFVASRDDEGGWSAEQIAILTDVGRLAEHALDAIHAAESAPVDAAIIELFDRITDPLIIFRPDLSVTSVNTAASTLMAGILDDDNPSLIGSAMAELFSPEVADALVDMAGRCRFRHATIQRRYFWPELGRWYSAHAYPLQDGVALRLHDINELKLDEERLTNEATHLAAIIRAQRDIAAHELNFERLTRSVVEHARELTGAAGASIEIMRGEALVCDAATGVLSTRLGERYQIDALAATGLSPDQKLLCVGDTQVNPLPVCDLLQSLGLRSMVLAPLTSEGLSTGLLRLGWLDSNAFNARDVQSIELLAALTSVTLQRANDYETKQRLLLERTEALNALRESEESFQKIFAEAAVGEIITTLDGRFLQVNRAFCQITGYDEDELKVTDILAITHPDDLELSIERYRQLIEDSIPYFHLETRYLRRDGQIVSVLLSSSLARDADGEPLYVIGLIQDVTERKLAEERRREVEARYRSLVEQVPAVIYIAASGEDSTTVYVSPQMETLLGYSPAEWLANPRSWLDCLHPEDRDRVLEEFSPDAPGSSLHSEYRLRTSDGHYIWVRDEATLIYDEAGNPLYWQGFLTDITERRRAENEMLELEEKYRSLVDNANDFIVVYGPNAELIFVNQTFQQRYGYSNEEALRLKIDDLVHPDDISWVRDYLQQRLRGEDVPGSYQMRTLTRDGSIVYVEANTSPILDSECNIVAIQAIARDVSERQLAEQRLAESEQRYRSLFYHNPDAVFSLDPNGRCLAVNPACEVITGYAGEEIVSRPWSSYIVREDLRSALRHFARTVRGEPQTFEIGIARKSGERARLNVTTLPIMVGNEIVGIYGIAKDETERRALEEQLAHQAFHDSLTHLPNRMLFLDRLQQALARTARSHAKLAVLFLDLDNFKVINDSLGHEVGDQLLISVAERLHASMRSGDTAARLGGDEFILLLEEISSVKDAERVAQRVHDILKEPFFVRDREIFVTPSIGIAISASPDDRPDELLRNADVAMYRAKRNGRACYELFDPLMHVRVLQRLELERDLRQAIEHQEFVVHYQPKLDLASGRIVEMEALARWLHPEQGIIAPNDFVPVAEETGLIIPIGRWVLQEACAQMQDWRLRYGSHAPELVSVNLSAVQLRMPNLVEEVSATLRQTGLDPRHLCLEITESAVMDNADLAMTTLTGLKELGVQLAIDDFGTGYSSLSYLKRFTVDVLKIDQSFVAELSVGEENAVIVGLTIRLAHALGMRVVAEGVETKEQLDRLREMECDLAQGYYIARPLPAASIAALIGSRSIR